MRKALLIAAVVWIFCAAAQALEIVRNESPIYDAPPRLIKEIENGRLEAAGEGDDEIRILHLWGTPREMGIAHGKLLKEEVNTSVRSLVQLMAIELGGTKMLDDVYKATKPYWPPHFMEELKGLAEGSGAPLAMLIRAAMIGEAGEWHCSLYGAWGEATRNGHLMQLRCLDYAVNAEIQRYPVVIVYHPNEGNGHKFANIAWAGVVGSVSGISEIPLAISEIGDDYDKDNDSFEGIPFMFLLRDILQFDKSLDEAIERVRKGPRTTSLIYAIGDGRLGQARSLQTSRTLCNVFDPDNLEPNVPTHPRIKNIVYHGMSWNVPAYDKPLHDMLKRHYGKIDAEVTIREILPTVRTGNLQVVVYDLTDKVIWTANAQSLANKEKGPLDAYKRAYVRLDMNKVFATPRPNVQAAQ